MYSMGLFGFGSGSMSAEVMISLGRAKGPKPSGQVNIWEQMLVLCVGTESEREVSMWYPPEDRGQQLSALGPHRGDSTLQCVAVAGSWLVLGLSFLFCERVEFSFKKQTAKEEAGWPSTGM